MRIKPLLDKWIDLTHLISPQTIVYPGDPQLEILRSNTVLTNGFQLDTIKTAMHVGTHLDSPAHFIHQGRSIDQIPLDKIGGMASQIQVTPQNGVLLTESIDLAYAKLSNPHKILLISSGHSQLFNTNEYFSKCPAFEPSFFDFVISHQIECIGLDLPTIQYHHDSPKRAHLDFLGREIIIIEGLNHLDKLTEEVFFIGFPLKIEGLDGSMIRAAAMIKDNK